MRPRSKIALQFCEMAEQLPPLDEKRKEWAKGLFPAQALYFSRRGNNCDFWCQCCGTIVPTQGKWLLVDYAADTWTCPNCGAVCEVLPQYSKFFIHSKAPDNCKECTLVDVFKGVQVFRTFMVYRFNGRGKDDEKGRWTGKSTEFEYHEVFQNWILDNGKEIITSRSYDRGYNHFNWHHFSPYGVNRHNPTCSGYYQFEDVFDLEGNYIFPGQKVTHTLKRNGWSARHFPKKADPAVLAKKLITHPEYETLMKAGQSGVVYYLMSHPRVNIRDYWGPIKICIRNNYRVTDGGLWFDYINDLMFLGLDIHNAHYVCPENLRRAHEVMGRRRGRIVAEKDARDNAIEARKYEKTYRQEKKPFLGLSFGDASVRVSVLNSVEAVRQEGEAMHHCVFTNGYYKRDDCLLLSARTATTGKRLETVEISLKSFKVVQSRALQNGMTKEHNHILQLCEDNIPLLKTAAAKMKKRLSNNLAV